jgi:hypothetical protein
VRGALKTLERERPVVLSELSFEMLGRVSRVDPLSYLSLFTGLGYAINIIDRDAPGSLIAVESAEKLVAQWPDPLHVEDLLLLP